MLIPAGLPEANLTLPTTVSGGGRSGLMLVAVADASTTSPSPVSQANELALITQIPCTRHSLVSVLFGTLKQPVVSVLAQVA